MSEYKQVFISTYLLNASDVYESMIFKVEIDWNCKNIDEAGKVDGIEKFESEAAKGCPLYVIHQEIPSFLTRTDQRCIFLDTVAKSGRGRWNSYAGKKWPPLI